MPDNNEEYYTTFKEIWSFQYIFVYIYISFIDNLINNDGLKALGNLILQDKLPELEYLNIKGNKTGDLGIYHLSLTLKDKSLPNLRTLDLSDNFICDTGLSRLVNSLISGRTLKIHTIILNRINFSFIF